MKALHLGAGNIGRGFIGKVLADAGLEVIFADVNQPLLDLINQNKEYTVRVVGEDEVLDTVKGVSAVHSSGDEIIDLISQVDLITTAVGPLVLEKIAAHIAKGLEAREHAGNLKPLNIIACENMVRGTTQFKNHILSHLSDETKSWVFAHVGFVDSAVDRIVPPVVVSDNDPLQVTVESFSEWIVDETQFIGPIPDIKGMEKTDQLMAFVERKLFTLNTGHTITAYLGQMKNFNFIRDAILDPTIRKIAKEAMLESGEVLINRYGFDKAAHLAYIDKIISRFENPYLEDDVTRVGRQPIRKLSHNDRFIKPLMGTVEYQLPRANLLKGVVGALKFKCSDDPQANELAEMLQESSVIEVLSKITGLAKDDILLAEIEKVYNQNTIF